jgi:hypothetical protein
MRCGTWDHGLARHLERGFWASLPWLEDNVLAAILARGLELNEMQTEHDRFDVTSDAFRASLGLIASAYDGGFLDE